MQINSLLPFRTPPQRRWQSFLILPAAIDTAQYHNYFFSTLHQMVLNYFNFALQSGTQESNNLENGGRYQDF